MPQVEQARYMEIQIARGGLTLAELLQLPPRAEYYLVNAALEFGRTAEYAKGDLREYAIYNQAQALARLDDI